jgi:betaine lipid synthase
MGKGMDGRPRDNFLKKNFSFDKLTNLSGVKDDLTVLGHLWFNKAKGDDHAARLESFYGPQAEACT